MTIGVGGVEQHLFGLIHTLLLQQCHNICKLFRLMLHKQAISLNKMEKCLSFIFFFIWILTLNKKGLYFKMLRENDSVFDEQEEAVR